MEWINIKEKKPEHRQKVLISDGEIVTAAEADLKFNAHSDGSIWWDGCEFSGYEWEWDFGERFVTHWMPLPESPNKQIQPTNNSRANLKSNT